MNLLCFFSIIFTLNCIFFQSSTAQASVKDELLCTSCRVFSFILEPLWQENATKNHIVTVIAYLCQRLEIQEYPVCKGIANEFREEFLYVMGKLTLAPRQLCGFLIPRCGNPMNPFDENWSLSLPPGKPIPRKPEIPAGEPIMRILQITDIHFDSLYSPGSEADCNLPLCCHEANKSTNSAKITHKLPFYDLARHPAGYWGTSAVCDIPYWTLENMFQHLNRTQLFDYVLITGDLMPHSDWLYTKIGHVKIISNLTKLVDRYFPNTPTFWAVGNHEGVPVNSFAPHNLPKKYWPSWLYNSLNDSWKRWLSKRTERDILFRASYSTLITDKLRLVSINTGYCDNTNFWIYLNQTDPDGTLAWLMTELSSSESKGEKVQIIGHIPSGVAECLEGWASNYYAIVNRFESTIVGQFFGHTHFDSFQVFYQNADDFQSRPTELMYIAPSVTTFPYHNPAYRIYTIDGDYNGSTFEVLDHETWILNLTEANKPNGIPKWTKFYSAKSEYNLESLQPENWSELIDKLKVDDKKFERFARNYYHNNYFNCDEKCRIRVLCSLRSGHHNESSLCSDLIGIHSHFNAFSVKISKKPHGLSDQF